MLHCEDAGVILSTAGRLASAGRGITPTSGGGFIEMIDCVESDAIDSAETEAGETNGWILKGIRAPTFTIFLHSQNQQTLKLPASG
jgi:hypothetical protein